MTSGHLVGLGPDDTGGPCTVVAMSGLDGAGKSTATRSVVSWLRARGLRVQHVKVPDLRTWALLEQLGAPGEPYAEHARDADRIAVALNLERLGWVLDHVVPLASQCDVIVVDRFVLDWCAVGRAFGAGEHEVTLLRGMQRMIPVPVETVLIDVPPAIADARIRARRGVPDEREGLDSLERTASAYADVLDALTPSAHVVDGRAAPDEVVMEIVASLARRGALASRLSGSAQRAADAAG